MQLSQENATMHNTSLGLHMSLMSPPQIFKTLQKWNAPIYASVCIKNNYWDERSMKTEFEHKNHKYEPKYM